MPKPTDHLVAARRVLDIEAEAIAELSSRLDEQFSQAVELVLASSGRVIVCGMGKSGIVGRKIAATLSSTGTPSFYMHPGEAFHGDLGMVTAQDVFIAISYSGETEEVVKLLPFLRDNGNTLIAMTGNAGSTLAKVATVHLDVHVAKEACPLQLAPTSSTTASLAMGDALAVALMEASGFQSEHFARFHPGGSLGRRLLGRVDDEMLADDLPLVEPTASLIDVLAAITRSRMGIVVVPGPEGIAVITDGDVRRAIEADRHAVFDRRASDLMNDSPLAVESGARISDTIALMERHGVSTILVMKQEELVGLFSR